jgi:hypothetical protein
VKSRTTPGFRRAYHKLPAAIQAEARRAYKLWKAHPSHPGLHFELISADPPPPLWSVRVTLNYRALGVKHGDTMTWVWIGDHSEYEKRI